jgi:aminopeptidase N
MMRGFLGEDVFKLALTNYLNKFSYSNAVGDDLWNEMEAVAKTKNILNESLSVKKIMDSWTIDSAGFPVVTVRRNGTDLVISQQRYFLPYINDNDTTSWYIPISYSTKSRSPTNEIPEYWLTKEQNEVLVIENAAENDEWVYININRTGYFRTNYDQLSWKNLIKGMADLSDVTRGMLIDDAFALARANLTDYDIPLTLGVFLRNMEMTSDNLNYLSWYAFEGGLEYLNNMLKRESAYGSLRTVMKYIVSVPFENYNFDEIVDQTDLDILHRQRIVQMACDYGIDKCLQTAQLIFRNWIENKNENK